MTDHLTDGPTDRRNYLFGNWINIFQSVSFWSRLCASDNTHITHWQDLTLLDGFGQLSRTRVSLTSFVVGLVCPSVGLSVCKAFLSYVSPVLASSITRFPSCISLGYENTSSFYSMLTCCRFLDHFFSPRESWSMLCPRATKLDQQR